jgi:DNA gyrase inhibitor GyrI
MGNVVMLPPRRVAYTTSVGDPSKSDAFIRLEQVVPLNGNRFYATFDRKTQEYRACVALRDGESSDRYGLPEFTIDGGPYASATLKGAYEDIVKLIAPTFERLGTEHVVDAKRRSLEFYKRHTEIILYLPVDTAVERG